MNRGYAARSQADEATGSGEVMWVSGIEGLVEREHACATLAAAANRARDGHGSVVAILGAAGTGASTMLRHAGEQADLHVLCATGDAHERELAFGVVRQLLGETVGATATVTERDGTLRRAASALGLDGRELASEATGELLHGLHGLVATLAASAPLLLAVDDVHEADGPSLAFLAYLARRIAALPVLLLVAGRGADPVAEREAVRELLDDPSVRELALGPLTHAGVARLLGSVTGRPSGSALLARAWWETGGNPRLVQALAAALGTIGSPEDDEALDAAFGAALDAAAMSLRRAVARRLRGLGPDVPAIAEAVAILGDGCTTAEAALLADVDADGATAAVADLMRCEILAARDVLGYVAPLVRAAVEAGLTPADRGLAHARAARLLLAREAAPERIVAQLLRSPPGIGPEAAAVLRDSGRDATADGAPATGARYLRRALDEDPGGDRGGELAFELGAAHLLAGAASDAIPMLRRGYERSGDSSTLAARGRMLWLAHLNADTIGAGVEMLEDAVRRVDADDDDARLTLEAEFYTATTLQPARLRAMWGRLAPFASLPGETPAQRRMLAVLTADRLHSPGVAASEVGDLVRRAYADGQGVTDNAVDPTQWVLCIGALIMTDALAAAESALALAQGLATTSGSPEALAIVCDLRAMLALRQGRMVEAEIRAREGLTLVAGPANQLRDLIRMGNLRYALPTLIVRGRFDEADRLLRDHRLDGPLPEDLRHVKFAYERGLLRLQQGRTEDALADARLVRDFNAAYGLEDVADAPWRRLAALALSRLGDSEAAVGVADEQLALARAWGLTRDIGAALSARGVAEADAERRIAIAGEAVATLRDAPAPLELSVAEVQLGRALLRAGRRTDAREALARARDGAIRCGAITIAERARADLRVAGARPRRTMSTGVEALTPAERRTAGLAATGMTNRAIARSLVLSIRTVENTLHRAFRKLDIGSRSQLPAALAPAQPAPHAVAAPGDGGRTDHDNGNGNGNGNAADGGDRPDIGNGASRRNGADSGDGQNGGAGA